MPDDDFKQHSDNCAVAKRIYLEKFNAESGAKDWQFAMAEARVVIKRALVESDYLRDIPGALGVSGSHMVAFRHLMAPPTSQDQFKLLCPSWPKSSEKNGRPIELIKAGEIASALSDWLDKTLVPWIFENRDAAEMEIEAVLSRAGALIASQKTQTARRSRLSNEQEQEVVGRLSSKGWQKLPSKLIDTRAEIPRKHFMHKTRFATNTSAHQEVDIACGLSGSYVLAMECKVTNDETNSVKRINDILKKATAWRDHWGSFVETAALLQGVIAPKDVQRLSANNVRVFWSHDLEAFENWLAQKIA